MLNKIYPLTEKPYINSRKTKKNVNKPFGYSHVLHPKVILPVVTSTVLITAVSFGALLLKRIIDNTKPPRK